MIFLVRRSFVDDPAVFKLMDCRQRGRHPGRPALVVESLDVARNRSLVLRRGSLNVMDVVDFSARDWRLAELRGVAIDFTDLHHMAPTVRFHFVDWRQRVGIADGRELFVALAVHVAGVDLVIWDVGDPVLLENLGLGLVDVVYVHVISALDFFQFAVGVSFGSFDVRDVELVVEVVFIFDFFLLFDARGDEVGERVADESVSCLWNLRLVFTLEDIKPVFMRIVVGLLELFKSGAGVIVADGCVIVAALACKLFLHPLLPGDEFFIDSAIILDRVGVAVCVAAAVLVTHKI